jgi:hypothetical protein
MQVTDEMVEVAYTEMRKAGYIIHHIPVVQHAIEAALQAAWQTMETAPKDGTPVYFVDGNGQYGICWWDKRYDLGKQSFIFGWMSDSCKDFGGFEEPTYWTELPKYKGE